jgi:hypothetical protein
VRNKKAPNIAVVAIPTARYEPARARSARIRSGSSGWRARDSSATHERLLGGRDLIVLAARGGGYAPGTPREGWDHAEQWLPHGLSVTGLTPRFITAELTLADENPAMAAFKPLAAESLTAAETAIDALWETDAVAA